MAYELIILRLLHIVCGVLWVGGATFNAVFLLPSLKPGTPTFGEVMQGLMQRRFFQAMLAFGVITVLSGARLMMIVSGGQGSWFASRTGQTLSIAAACAVTALVIGLAVARPAATRATALAAQRVNAKDDAERASIDGRIAMYRKRGLLAGQIAITLILVATAGMAIARYL